MTCALDGGPGTCGWPDCKFQGECTVKKEFVRNPYNYDSDEESLLTGLECKDKSLAQQQFKEESDINFIANRFGLTGEMPQLPNGFEWGAQFDEVFDYQTAMNTIVAADRAFMQLPAKVRREFDNDPQQLLQFLEDDKNRDEARRLGLLKPLQDLPQSPQGGPASSGKGDTLSPAPTAPEAPLSPRQT